MGAALLRPAALTARLNPTAPWLPGLQIGVHASDRNQDATCYVGNLDPQCSEELVWELFVQAGPVGE